MEGRSYSLVSAPGRRASEATISGCAKSQLGQDPATKAALAATPSRPPPTDAELSTSQRRRGLYSDLEGRGNSSGQTAEQKRKKERLEKLKIIEERLRRLEMADRQLDTRLSKMKRQAQDMDHASEELHKMQNRMTRMMRWSNTVLHADVAAEMVQTLQEHSRLHALGHISSMNVLGRKPWGREVLHLAKDWAHTYQTVLSPAQKQAIKKEFGPQVISFMEASLGTANAITSAHTHTDYLDMPLGGRAFLMDAIDALQPGAVRAGGRRAYLALFGGKSWEEAKETVIAQLAAACGHR